MNLHFAHGFLSQSFFSPLANKRTTNLKVPDEYIRTEQLGQVMLGKALLSAPHWSYHPSQTSAVKTPRSKLPK